MVAIFFEYFRHRGPGAASGAIIATAGGPGASITQNSFLRDAHLGLFDPLRAKRDVILLDQRGVGRSGAIDCKRAQHGSAHVYRDVRACGKQLGFAAPLYGSADVALDIEAVRAALGIDKLDFYGGSGAALDIQAYAVRFPAHLRVAVLDSPGTSLGFNDFDPGSPRGFKRAVRLICARSGSCRAERRNAVSSLAWLARRLRNRPLKGVGRDASGHRHRLRVTESFLLWLILNTDAGGYVSDSEIGAAADALRGGDRVPLLRLAAEEDIPPFEDSGDPKVFSVGDNLARFCTDLRMPWDKSASLATRLRQWRAARAALPQIVFSPFSIDGWLAPFPIGPIDPDACIEWPAPGRQVAPPVPRGAKFPAKVPALILSGDLDFETGSPAARRLAKAWPHSRFVEIANSGHHTALNSRRDCSQPMVVNFVAKLKPGNTRCASRTRFTFPSVGRFALTAARARPAKRRRGDDSTKTDRKVATVATAAVTDAFRRSFLHMNPGPGVGLRGGTFSDNFRPGCCDIDTLHRVRFARDVAVTGTTRYHFNSESITATITVDGPGRENGKLHISGAWFALRHKATVLKINGKLGGRRVVLRVPAT
jgi:pimeloyl-ACP methyl ester carboxylesterase